MPPPKVYFRFAEEEDAQDITDVIHRAYAIELTKGDNIVAFRPTFPSQWTPTCIAQQIEDTTHTWYVAERANDNMDIIAVCHFHVDPTINHVAVCHVLGVLPEYQQQGLGRRMLSAIENICVHHHRAPTLSIKTSHTRTDVHSFLKKRHYREVEGGLWATTTDEPIEPGVYFNHYRKALPVEESHVMVEKADTNNNRSTESSSSNRIVDESSSDEGQDLEDLVKLLAQQIRSSGLLHQTTTEATLL